MIDENFNFNFEKFSKILDSISRLDISENPYSILEENKELSEVNFNGKLFDNYKDSLSKKLNDFKSLLYPSGYSGHEIVPLFKIIDKRLHETKWDIIDLKNMEPKYKSDLIFKEALKLFQDSETELRNKFDQAIVDHEIGKRGIKLRSSKSKILICSQELIDKGLVHGEVRDLYRSLSGNHFLSDVLWKDSASLGRFIRGIKSIDIKADVFGKRISWTRIQKVFSTNQKGKSITKSVRAEIHETKFNEDCDEFTAVQMLKN